MARDGCLRAGLCLSVVFALAGCAGENVPEAQLARAQLAVDRAVAAQAGTRAPTELTRAQDQLRDARKAVDDEDYTTARRLADQAEVDATLAETRAQAAAESENLQQMQGTTGDVRQTAVPPPTELVPK
jgi:hypothetical protein